MFSLGLQLLLSVAPSIYKLFTSDDKTEAAKDLTKNVIQNVGKEFGVNFETKDDVVKYVEQNPETVVKLKELENQYSIRVEELKLEDKKLDYENEQKQEGNRTERWKSDNSSDSRFAKLLRPSLTVYCIFIVTILAICDGNIGSFNIKEVWTTLFVTLCLTTVNGYFLLRTYEKRTGTSVWKR
jgi:cation transport ATPase